MNDAIESTRRHGRLGVALCACLLGFAATAHAVPVIPTSYDMANGHGQASGGTFNYWDLDYTGTGSVAPTTAPHNNDGELLSGGLGDLTDGVIATDNWFNVENNAGTGPYVGWRNFTPTIDFNFGGPVLIESVTLYLDDANGAGAVSVPASVDINGTNFSIVDPASDDPIAVTIDGLSEFGSTLSITLNPNNQWVFLSEVTFANSTAAVPEPATIGLLGFSLAGLAVAARRRKRRAEIR